MYKTQIIKNQDKITTENLKAYKDYLERLSKVTTDYELIELD